MDHPRERLLSMTEAIDTTCGGGAAEIIESWPNNDWIWMNCFRSYDYTASMSGRFNGVQKQIQGKLGGNVQYSPCAAHCSNTVIEHRCKASAVITKLFNILEALFIFETASPKRNSSLEESIQFTGLDDALTCGISPELAGQLAPSQSSLYGPAMKPL